jgi:hypothetical protein
MLISVCSAITMIASLEGPSRMVSTSHLHHQTSRIKPNNGPSKLKKIVQSKEFQDLGKKMKRQGLHSKKSDVENLFELSPIQEPITVSFTNLNLFIKNDRKHIIKNLFGIVRPYNITALLGTSGSGM